ncbi:MULTISPECIES: TetR family transcriptional regulator [unclassified Undibacterium]|uniref:TetR family transcriptional regulator n=1 Tax=unclassified Undibacterium TaxID=2630295 RepID=UPI002AC93BA9|nr:MULTISPECIES: TetR family transcriptional regulator [unclassified Undibacterium]MEB0137622.1 TetR family transcriptional regulator [Undibacterium sp. CCC2.1]MEB0170623.1 TetR family transcriptional regulator [Undibacterium sp. CCC1.1]MEB0174564.1 TetR family transcriptional regulator [Undibacterium sp. CCC3.4]MEB0213639.1 TetR family transcriptional regulator [Undibacterium sp. 5I2]WPX43807.1 TetR family transcriptional regulator [Undibacterium sp. CCC3.4]
MVRKTKEDTQETYSALLTAAEQVFSEKGVTRTTLNDVAVAAGMTRGAIYWHFKDKNALFQAMCDRAFLPMEVLLNEISGTPDAEPLAALRQLNVHFLQLVASGQRQRRVCDIIYHRCEKNIEMLFFEDERLKRGECLAKVQAIIETAAKQGQLPADTDAALVMQANHAFLVGIIHQWLEDPSAYSLTEHAEAMMDMFLAGMVACPPRKKAALD